MTPTLFGRWQTRLLLLFTVGAIVTFFFAVWFDSIAFGVFDVPFILLFWVAVLGVAWDVLFNVWQRRRWDSDWPPAYQLIAGILEGTLLFGLVRAGLLPGVPEDIPAWMFLSHYCTVWYITFLMTQGPMRILFPQWRFRGGQLGRHPHVRGES